MGLQRIWWRCFKKDPIHWYSLTTETYRTASVPYLAASCLQQMAEDQEHFPLASQVTIQDFYVDDILMTHTKLNKH
jgi:hypothetical protein